LSRLPPFDQRATWGAMNIPQWRCDPGILSVNRQIYEEASEILYRCNFIIEINRRVDKDDQDVYDAKWRGSRLTGIFPFHKAKQITLQVEASLSFSPMVSLFQMIYICGLLSSEGNTPQRLRVELGTNPEFGVDDLRRTGQNELAVIWFADRFEFFPGSMPDDFDSHIALLLQPLALLKRVTDLKIVFPEHDEFNENFKGLFQIYENALADQTRTSDEESRWVWLQYVSILVEEEQEERRKQQMKLEYHESWIEYTYKEYNCKHPGFRKKFFRRKLGKVRCSGCDRWWAWLTECRKCGMIACASCRADLKHKQPVLEEARKLREGDDLGSALLDFGSAVVPGW
ncbi:MAG: hypothetical protein Q9224_006449, partial [Gallowayella concinna]